MTNAKPPIIVAEIGCNHQGVLAKAQRMVDTVGGFCRHALTTDELLPAPTVKFQKRTPGARPELYEQLHPNPHHAFGMTYGEHRDALEFSKGEHALLRSQCHDLGLGYACSVWDVQAADDIIDIKPDWIKIPSAHNRDFALVDHVFDNWKGPIHISLGMTTYQDVQMIVARYAMRPHHIVLYHTTSAYPVDASNVHLGEIPRLLTMYPDMINEIGYSGHHNGIAIDVAAMALGVAYIERHFTLNRTWKGTDHAASLEPDGLRRLMRDVWIAWRAMSRRPGDKLPHIEHEARNKLQVVSK